MKFEFFTTPEQAKIKKSRNQYEKEVVDVRRTQNKELKEKRDKKNENLYCKMTFLEKLFETKLISKEDLIRGDAYLENDIRQKIASTKSEEERKNFEEILRKLQDSFVVSKKTYSFTDKGSTLEAWWLSGYIRGKRIEIVPYTDKSTIDGTTVLDNKNCKEILNEYFEVGEMRQEMIIKIINSKVDETLFPARLREEKEKQKFFKKIEAEENAKVEKEKIAKGLSEEKTREIID